MIINISLIDLEQDKIFLNKSKSLKLDLIESYFLLIALYHQLGFFL